MSGKFMPFDEMASTVGNAARQHWVGLVIMAAFFTAITFVLLYAGGPATEGYLAYMLGGDLKAYMAWTGSLQMSGKLGAFYIFLMLIMLLQLVAQIFYVRIVDQGADKAFEGQSLAMMKRVLRLLWRYFLIAFGSGLLMGLVLLIGIFLSKQMPSAKILFGGLAAATFVVLAAIVICALYAATYDIALDRMKSVRSLFARLRFGRIWRMLVFGIVIGIAYYVAFGLLQLVIQLILPHAVAGWIVGPPKLAAGLIISGMVIHAAGLQFSHAEDEALPAPE